MDPSAISLILQELNLNGDDVANIYHHGSWVYGSNTPESDRDLIFVTRSPAQKPIQFHTDFNYFHEFELHRLWNEYDVCIYSVENFELLLEKHFLNAVQCLFLPDPFKLKEEIDFRTIFLDKYCNPLRIKQAAVHEMSRDFNLYYSKDYPGHRACSSKQLTTNQSRESYVFKNLFHGIRYLDFAEQLLQTKSIFDFTRATHIFDQMKAIRENATDLEPVVEFVHKKSFEYKPKLEALAPGNIVKGVLEVEITFTYTDDGLDQLNKACENTRYKLHFHEWTTFQKDQELQVSSTYEGEYPAIVQQIESDARDHFKDFPIIRIKIQTSVHSSGVPQDDFEKRFLWNDTTNYFQLTYNFPLDKHVKKTVKHLREICRSLFKHEMQLTHTFIHEDYFVLTRFLVDVGLTSAISKSNEMKRSFARQNFFPLETLGEFVIHDRDVTLN